MAEQQITPESILKPDQSTETGTEFKRGPDLVEGNTELQSAPESGNTALETNQSTEAPTTITQEHEVAPQTSGNQPSKISPMDAPDLSPDKKIALLNQIIGGGSTLSVKEINDILPSGMEDTTGK